ncbi:MAG: hypothetical protein QOE87_3381 [Gaiellales bacterium]|nr:hypothetical protein [Gaiellales bacterium]
MRQRLKRMFLLAAVGFAGKQIRKKFLQKRDAGRGVPDANPSAAPFETHVRGDSVHYAATNPAERDPRDPDEPFGGEPLR